MSLDEWVKWDDEDEVRWIRSTMKMSLDEMSNLDEWTEPTRWMNFQHSMRWDDLQHDEDEWLDEFNSMSWPNSMRWRWVQLDEDELGTRWDSMRWARTKMNRREDEWARTKMNDSMSQDAFKSFSAAIEENSGLDVFCDYIFSQINFRFLVTNVSTVLFLERTIEVTRSISNESWIFTRNSDLSSYFICIKRTINR